MKNLRSFGLLLLLLPLLLAGCFQQAGEAIQPVNITEAPLVEGVPDNADPAAVSLPEDNSSDGIPADADAGTSLTDFPATATLELAITIISPTFVLPDTAETSGGGEASTDALVTPEVQTFRTPSSPLGQVTQEPLELAVATATPSGLITPTAFSDGGITSAAGECTYTIQRGDTLFRIATANNTTIAAMREANPEIGSGDLIQPGQTLKLPGCGTADSSAAVPPAPTTAPESQVNPPVPGEGQVHTVQAGETLFAIAQKYGVTVQAIVSANSLSNPNRLDVGQQLIIPPGS